MGQLVLPAWEGPHTGLLSAFVLTYWPPPCPTLGRGPATVGHFRGAVIKLPTHKEAAGKERDDWVWSPHGLAPPASQVRARQGGRPQVLEPPALPPTSPASWCL